MIQITDKHNCCGCEACAQSCPKTCISMIRDAEGFLYPHADSNVCINCGICEKVCPVINQNEPRQPRMVLAAINRDDEVRRQSSSGGVFTVLAQQIIEKGGVVFGARFDNQWQVVIDYAETLEAITPFQGSKYVQAQTNGSFKQCKRFLEAGRDVMYCGTPCQIAGLQHFLRGEYSNLLAVEVICHGVPSPAVWGHYLDEVISHGTGKNGYTLHDGNKIRLVFPHTKNTFMRAYLSDLISRPSCSACPAKDGKSNADITLADFWGIEQEDPSMFDDRGTSMILVHSEKGMAAIPFERINCKESNSGVLKHNMSYKVSAHAHAKREVFFKSLETTDDLHKMIDYILRPTLAQRVAKLKNPLSYPKRMAYNILQPVLKPAPKPTGGGYLSTGQYYKLITKSSSPKITGISFRNKSSGWKSYSLVIEIQLD